ncbi:sigma-70 family RNA polymerase sigma factor [Brevibacillus ruminantium]|uniref:RNA polymerase sigma factor n=1 Tax=Brevibacillus ruminantium TaxID=2950604 RepID=A0ABY4WD83_9BACL|nr:sigma-70 family RNA polymerase sigma factor [Brevibacillus ruminantium]USG63887.1 sigma-70 family RNA polymerase sigma factor [Brevibacillus ruminantium]
MDKLQQTTEASLDRLMREYGTRVLRLVTLMVKDRALAEDITQDVFLKVYRNLAAFRGESSVHTWIYRIAVNECKGHMRSWAFRNLLPHSWIQKAGDVSTEGIVVERAAKDELVRLVLALPPLYRQAVALHYYAEMSIAEVAEVLGVTEGTVRTRLHRARQRLKEDMRNGEGWEWTETNG